MPRRVARTDLRGRRRSNAPSLPDGTAVSPCGRWTIVVERSLTGLHQLRCGTGWCMQPGVRQALATLYRICARYPFRVASFPRAEVTAQKVPGTERDVHALVGSESVDVQVDRLGHDLTTSKEFAEDSDG